MATDERFVDSAARSQNGEACVARLDEALRQPDRWPMVSEALRRLRRACGAPYQTLDELYEDVQVIANGYLPTMTAGNGEEVQLVASPAQFDEAPVDGRPAPRSTASTPSWSCMDLGYDWDQIAALKESGAIL